MFSRNIELQHQVALTDFNNCKSDLSRSGARGAQGNCRTEKPDPSRSRYTQSPNAASGDRSNGSELGRSGVSDGASVPSRCQGEGGTNAASAAH